MDGFFEKYGRIIIIAMAICFVLLYLTPMRNVVGSSINGFAGNFANKVGQSIGAVKMPDGSGNIAKEKSSMLITGEEFNNKIPSKATTVIFTDEKAPKGTPTTDLTVKKDEDVVGWLDGTTWKVSTQDSNKVVNFNENSSKMFYEKKGLTNIDLNNVDTSNVTDMENMFSFCRPLNSLDLSNFDTSQVTNMDSMFACCNSLTSLELSNKFNTSKVTNMDSMFAACNSLISLDLSNFNTSKVTNMKAMFHNCISLTNLDLSNFDTSKVTSMNYMFEECTNLKSITSTQATKDKLLSLNTKVPSGCNWTIIDSK